MPNIASYLDAFSDAVTYSAISKATIGLPRHVKFIKHFDIQRKDTIYVGSSRDIDAALSAAGYHTESITFFACDDEVDLKSIATTHGLNMVCVSCNLLDAYERLSQVVDGYTQWRMTLLEVANRTQSIQEIIRAASRLTDSSIFLLNRVQQVVYSSTTDAETSELLCAEMNTTGRLSESTMRAISRAETTSLDTSECRMPDDGGFVFFKHDTIKGGKLIHTMLLVRTEAKPRIDAEAFLQIMGDTIDLMTSNQNVSYWAGEDFKALLNDLLDMKLISEEEIVRKLSLLSVTPQRYIGFAIIDFENPDDFPNPPAYFITQVKDLFPNSNACVLNDSIVIMYGLSERSSVRSGCFNDERLHMLLAQRRAYAAISMATLHRSTLRQTFLLTQRIMSLAKELRPSKDDRVFLFEDYADYVLIDLSYPGFVSAFGHDEMVHLVHPDVIRLFRYDVRHNDNLLDVLYHYCMNGLNIVKTARAIYMHRNTIASKLKRIDELIYDDLSDGQIQQRIIISYKILRYLSLFEKIDLSKRVLSNMHE